MGNIMDVYKEIYNKDLVDEIKSPFYEHIETLDALLMLLGER